MNRYQFTQICINKKNKINLLRVIFVHWKEFLQNVLTPILVHVIVTTGHKEWLIQMSNE